VSKPKWPDEHAFYKLIQQYAKEITYGTLVALDPASGGSSSPGFCLFHAGEIQESGVLSLPSKTRPIHERLRVLYQRIQEITPTPPDVFVIERIRGEMAHLHLKWACGVSLAAAHTNLVIEVPIRAWHALRRSEGSTLKGDESDAIYIGQTVIKLAREYLNGEHTELFSQRKKRKAWTGGNPFASRGVTGKK